jgi:hypothetical protein
MLARRTVPRAARAIRPLPRRANIRFQTTTTGPHPPSPNSHLTHGLIGGLAGGAITLLLGYTYYRTSGLSTIVSTAQETKNYFKKATSAAKASAPEPNQALAWLRQTATSYASLIPGARGYVDSAFNDLEAIQQKHGEEVEQIVRDAYDELRSVGSGTKEGVMSVEAAYQAWNVVEDAMRKIGRLAGDAAEDIMNNHPQLKEKVGGSFDELKEMGEKYGPEAKKQVDDTWKQVQDILKGGVGVTTVEKVRSLVQEKMEKVREMGEEAWKKGLEEAKPYLDKNPQVKRLVEENREALMKGDVKELYEKVKKAVEGGDMGGLQDYVGKAAEKAKNASGGMGGLERYMKMVPGGDQILPKLGAMQEIAQKHGKEAERIAKEAWEEIGNVVSKKAEEAQKLKDKAERDAKK